VLATAKKRARSWAAAWGAGQWSGKFSHSSPVALVTSGGVPNMLSYAAWGAGGFAPEGGE
jgi:hypothetical protein